MNWVKQGPAAYVAVAAAVSIFWAIFFGPSMILLYANVGYRGIAYPALAFGLFALAAVIILAVSRRLSPSGWLAAPILIALLLLGGIYIVLSQPQTMTPVF
jgi:hypothetical protein